MRGGSAPPGCPQEEVGKQVGRSGATCRQRITRILDEPDPLRGVVVPRPRKAMDTGYPIGRGVTTGETILAGRAYRAPARMMGIPSEVMEPGR